MTTANESTLSDEIERDLRTDLLLAAPVGPQPESIPSCELYDYELTELRALAAGAIAGFYGPARQTAEFFKLILAGKLAAKELDELRLARSELSSSRYDDVLS